MKLPPHVVIEQNTGRETENELSEDAQYDWLSDEYSRATIDEEDDRHSRISHNDALGVLAGVRHLDLRSNEYNKSHGDEEPLVLDEPFQGCQSLLSCG